MESSSNLFGLSLSQTLRDGQLRVLREIANSPNLASLNVRLPTGYGKTFTAACAYSLLRRKGSVNRLLYIVPTTAQLTQFCNDGTDDLRDAGVDGPLSIGNIGYSLTQSLKNHRNNKCSVFACTIQAIADGSKSTLECVRELMQQGKWMGVIDEYQHYGLGKSWGKVISSIPFNFRLAMSATPYRPLGDEALGKPDIEVLYRKAAENERVVKILECHSYVYRIDAVMPDGSIRSFTTPELAAEAGSENPDDIERFRIDRQMRWSPKYVSPLIFNPIDRMEKMRIETGLPCQALVGAMACSHAQLVCDQIKSMYPYLRIDWVGTGAYGRPDDENRKIIEQFCPRKRDGKRKKEDIKLDVLVHVGMAGEGLDSVFVTEVIHLNPANRTNQNNQENGRAARLLPVSSDVSHEIQRGYINVDSCSPYSIYSGKRIMDAMDDLPPSENETDDPREPSDLSPLPDEPAIHIFDMKCIKIDRGEVMRMAAVISGLVKEWPASSLNDPDHPIHAAAENAYLELRRKQSEENNENSVHAQWKDHVSRAVGHVVHRAIRISTPDGGRIDRSLPGDLKRRVQQERAKLYGTYDSSDVEELRRQYCWLKTVEKSMIDTGEIPQWLR